MKIKMHLLSDVIFGNGASVPGGEDISVLRDDNGFPYYKGGTFKGIFREELERYLHWTMAEESTVQARLEELLGSSGNDREAEGKLVFSDFTLSEYVKEKVFAEIGEDREAVLDAFTNLRTFTSIDGDGTVSEGSLRSARCVNKGLYFYSEISGRREDEPLVREVISLVKWIGSMRNRGFGKVKIEPAEAGLEQGE